MIRSGDAAPTTVLPTPHHLSTSRIETEGTHSDRSEGAARRPSSAASGLSSSAAPSSSSSSTTASAAVPTVCAPRRSRDGQTGVEWADLTNTEGHSLRPCPTNLCSLPPSAASHGDTARHKSALSATAAAAGTGRGGGAMKGSIRFHSDSDTSSSSIAAKASSTSLVHRHSDPSDGAVSDRRSASAAWRGGGGSAAAAVVPSALSTTALSRRGGGVVVALPADRPTSPGSPSLSATNTTVVSSAPVLHRYRIPRHLFGGGSSVGSRPHAEHVPVAGPFTSTAATPTPPSIRSGVAQQSSVMAEATTRDGVWAAGSSVSAFRAATHALASGSLGGASLASVRERVRRAAQVFESTMNGTALGNEMTTMLGSAGGGDGGGAAASLLYPVQVARGYRRGVAPPGSGHQLGGDGGGYARVPQRGALPLSIEPPAFHSIDGGGVDESGFPSSAVTLLRGVKRRRSVTANSDYCSWQHFSLRGSSPSVSSSTTTSVAGSAVTAVTATRAASLAGHPNLHDALGQSGKVTPPPASPFEPLLRRAVCDTHAGLTTSRGGRPLHHQHNTTTTSSSSGSRVDTVKGNCGAWLDAATLCSAGTHPWWSMFASHALSRFLAAQLERDAPVLQAHVFNHSEMTVGIEGSRLRPPATGVHVFNSGGGAAAAQQQLSASSAWGAGSARNMAPHMTTTPFPSSFAASAAATSGGGGGGAATTTHSLSLYDELIRLFDYVEQMEGVVVELAVQCNTAGGAATKGGAAPSSDMSRGRGAIQRTTPTTERGGGAAASSNTGAVQAVTEAVAAVTRQWCDELVKRWPLALLSLGYVEWWLRHPAWDALAQQANSEDAKGDPQQEGQPVSWRASGDGGAQPADKRGVTASDEGRQDAKRNEEEGSRRGVGVEGGDVPQSRTASRLDTAQEQPSRLPASSKYPQQHQQQLDRLSLLHDTLRTATAEGMRRLFDTLVDSLIGSVRDLLQCCSCGCSSCSSSPSSCSSQQRTCGRRLFSASLPPALFSAAPLDLSTAHQRNALHHVWRSEEEEEDEERRRRHTAAAAATCHALLLTLISLYTVPPVPLLPLLKDNVAHSPATVVSARRQDKEASEESVTSPTNVERQPPHHSSSSSFIVAGARHAAKTAAAVAATGQPPERRAVTAAASPPPQQQQQRLHEERARVRQLHYQLMYAVCRLCNDLPLSWTSADVDSATAADGAEKTQKLTKSLSSASAGWTVHDIHHRSSIPWCVRHAELLAAAVLLAAAIAVPLSQVQLPMKGDLLCLTGRLAQRRGELVSNGGLSEREYATCMAQLGNLLTHAI